MYIEDRQLLDYLITRLPIEQQREFKSFKHLQREAAFLDRVFYVYTDQGSTSRGPNDPIIRTTVRIIDFGLQPRGGFVATLRDDNTHTEIQVSHTPVRLWEYPIYLAIPTRQTVALDVKQLADGSLAEGVSFALLAKMQTHGEGHTAGSTCIASPKKFKALFPQVIQTFGF